MAKLKTTSTENGHIVHLEDMNSSPELNGDTQSILQTSSVRRKISDTLSRNFTGKSIWWYGTGLALLVSVGAAYWIVRKRNLPFAMHSNIDTLMD